MSTRVELIEQRLRAALRVESLRVIDDSHLHAGHAGARAGGGHYRVHVISEDFAGRSRLERHRLVYQALNDLMRPDTIHALNVEALTPAEAESRSPRQP